MARFDWYQATVEAPIPVLRGALESLAQDGAWEPLRRAPHGYGGGEVLKSSDGAVATLWYAGTHQWPHVVASGEDAQRCAELLRAQFEGHAVSRADVCIDYGEPGAYDRLQGLALQVAEERGIKVGTAGDHLLTKQGRTLYLGATSSHTRLRLYDKAAELRQQFRADPVRLEAVPAELARLECQVRPQTRQAKVAAGQADPVALMGSAAWMRALMRLVAAVELEPFAAGKPWRQGDDDRAYAAVLAQYGGLFRRIVADLGSWECLGLQIGADLDARERVGRGSGRV